MGKVLNQSGLILGTNLFLHIQEVQDTDITVDATAHTLVQAAGDFTATSSVGGIIGSGFQVGDSFEVNSEVNGFVAVVDTVVALQVNYTLTSGVEVNEAAGATIDVQRQAKYIEYQEAGGLSFIDGVLSTAIHSKMQSLWKDSNLDSFDPLSGAIEPRGKAMYFLNFWDFFNLPTQKAHRGGAVQIQDTKSSPVKKIYGHLTAPKTVDVTDQWRFWQREEPQVNATVAAVTPQIIDELVLILDVANSIDKRGVWLARCAEPGKSVAMQLINMTYAETVSVTKTNAIDPILGDSSGAFVADATILAGGIYANIDVTKNATVALCNENVGVAGNVAITKVGANISVTGMAGGTATEKAVGTISLTALPTDGDTITLDDGVNPAVVFEFDNNAAVTGNNKAVLIGVDTKTTLTTLVDVISDVGSELTLNAGQGVHPNLVEGTSYDFANVTEYDSQDYKDVHTKLNWLLRQTTNINQDVAGPVLRGDKQFPISIFVGNTQSLDGFPSNFLSSNSNDMDLLDQCDVVREFNTIASFTIVVPQSFIDGTPSPQITIYVADTHGGSNASIVDNAAGTPQQDIILTAAETVISFAYSTFNGGGHTPNTPLDIAISFNQPNVAEAEVFFGNTIEANTTQRFQLAPSVDPSYVP